MSSTPTSSPKKKVANTSSLFKSPSSIVTGLKNKFRSSTNVSEDNEVPSGSKSKGKRRPKMQLVGEVDEQRKLQASSEESEGERESQSEHGISVSNTEDDEDTSCSEVAEKDKTTRRKNQVHVKKVLADREVEDTTSESFQSANETGNDSDNTEDDNTGDKKSKRQQLREQRDARELVFIKDDKKRTKQMKERGETLRQKARELALLTGAKVFFKAEYFSRKRQQPYTFQYGDDFCLDEGRVSPAKYCTIKEIVKDAVAKGMKDHLHSRASTTPSELLKGPETPKSSGKGKPRRPQKCCYICEQEDSDVCLFDHSGKVTKKIETQILACGFEENGKYCERLVHADCLGFPCVTLDIVEAMPDWFCKVHIAEGRNKNATPAAEPVAEPKKKGKKK